MTKQILTFALATLCTLPTIAQKRPNFLVIVCEDISSFLGCYGDEVALSPNLDKFAEQSTMLTNMYTTVGVSSPSRYSLITGRYSSNDGANYMRSNHFIKDFEPVLPDGVKCFTEYLRAEGYYCTNNQKTDYQFQAPLSAWDECGGKAHWRNAPADRPFYAQFNIDVTHESMIWKNNDKELFVDPKDIVLPPYYPDTETVRHDMAVMYSNIARMDKTFKGYLDELSSSPRAKNTIVIFFSDNGGPLPRGKRELLHSGAHVPFMIRELNQTESVKDDRLAMFIDIPATILSLANIQIPATIQGQALFGEQRAKDRKYAFGATDRFDEQFEKRGAIRDEEFLYVKNYQPNQSIYRPVEYRLQMPMMREMLELYSAGKLNDVQSVWFSDTAAEEELYNYIEDPHNIVNLATNPDYKKQLNRLRKAYQKEWIDGYNKRWISYSEKDFQDQMRPDGVKPKCPNPVVVRGEDGKLSLSNLDQSLSALYRKSGSKSWSLYTEPIDCQGAYEFVYCRIGYANSEIVN